LKDTKACGCCGEEQQITPPLGKNPLLLGEYWQDLPASGGVVENSLQDKQRMITDREGGKQKLTLEEGL
jgi:hypothetical protein